MKLGEKSKKRKCNWWAIARTTLVVLFRIQDEDNDRGSRVSRESRILARHGGGKKKEEREQEKDNQPHKNASNERVSGPMLNT